MPGFEYQSACYCVLYAYRVMLSECNMWLSLLHYKNHRSDKWKAFARGLEEEKGCNLNSGGH